jgi:hypothetical protein
VYSSSTCLPHRAAVALVADGRDADEHVRLVCGRVVLDAEVPRRRSLQFSAPPLLLASLPDGRLGMPRRQGIPYGISSLSAWYPRQHRTTTSRLAVQCSAVQCSGAAVAVNMRMSNYDIIAMRCSTATHAALLIALRVHVPCVPSGAACDDISAVVLPALPPAAARAMRHTARAAHTAGARRSSPPIHTAQEPV